MASSLSRKQPPPPSSSPYKTRSTATKRKRRGGAHSDDDYDDDDYSDTTTTTTISHTDSIDSSEDSVVKPFRKFNIKHRTSVGHKLTTITSPSKASSQRLPLPPDPDTNVKKEYKKRKTVQFDDVPRLHSSIDKQQSFPLPPPPLSDPISTATNKNDDFYSYPTKPWKMMATTTKQDLYSPSSKVEVPSITDVKCKFAKAGCPFKGTPKEVSNHEETYCAPLYRQLAHYRMYAAQLLNQIQQQQKGQGQGHQYYKDIKDVKDMKDVKSNIKDIKPLTFSSPLHSSLHRQASPPLSPSSNYSQHSIRKSSPKSMSLSPAKNIGGLALPFVVVKSSPPPHDKGRGQNDSKPLIGSISGSKGSSSSSSNSKTNTTQGTLASVSASSLASTSIPAPAPFTTNPAPLSTRNSSTDTDLIENSPLFQSLQLQIQRLQTDLSHTQLQLETEKNLRTERLRKSSEKCLELMNLSELGENKVEILRLKYFAERELREKLEEELENHKATAALAQEIRSSRNSMSMMQG